jgi:RES domain-containing protein
VSQFQPRDNRLLDAIENLPVVPFQANVWRVVREGRDPCRCSSAGNRWDTGEFEVLYTSLDRDGAIAEMSFHLRQGQPVFPSKLRYTLHEIRVNLNGVYDLSSPETLTSLGLNMARFGQLSYADRQSEYPSCQQIADAAHFLGSPEAGDASGILVPNARHSCTNLIIFCSHTKPSDFEEVANHGLIDWKQH